jgi:hypothetical protein
MFKKVRSFDGVFWNTLPMLGALSQRIAYVELAVLIACE